MVAEPLDLEPIKDEERGLLSDPEFQILTMFESAIESSPSLDEKAKHFVTALVASVPESQSDSDAEGMAMDTWQVLTYIACRTPCRHYAQDVLVQIVGMLNGHDAVKIWHDCPGFEISVRDSWNHGKLKEASPACCCSALICIITRSYI